MKRLVGVILIFIFLSTVNVDGKPSQEQPDESINQGCGYRNPEGVGFRITGATHNEAEFGEFNWIASVLKKEEVSAQILNVYQCGGALITPSVVMTSARCVSDKVAEMLKVRVGDWDIETDYEIFAHQDRDVIDVIIHPNYNKKNGLVNDIALIFLAKPVDIIDNVNVICLPPENFNFDESKCVAAGWGKDPFCEKGHFQPIQKCVDVSIIHKDECEAHLKSTRLGEDFVLNDNFICAAGDARNITLKIDGGSPLICSIPGMENRYYQVGIISWDTDCNRPNPNTYVNVNVPLFRKWIDEQLKKRNIDTSYYQPK